MVRKGFCCFSTIFPSPLPIVIFDILFIVSACRPCLESNFSSLSPPPGILSICNYGYNHQKQNTWLQNCRQTILSAHLAREMQQRNNDKAACNYLFQDLLRVFFPQTARQIHMPIIYLRNTGSGLVRNSIYLLQNWKVKGFFLLKVHNSLGQNIGCMIFWGQFSIGQLEREKGLCHDISCLFAKFKGLHQRSTINFEIIWSDHRVEIVLDTVEVPMVGSFP